jgi:hypothetical protein
MDEINDLDDGQDELEVQLVTIPADASDKIIEKHFATGRLRVIQDKNDFFLPHVLDFIEGRSWGNLRPEYQRRLRWDIPKKSKLIESFVMNVPVPPVFLYETDIGRFEVMDGQQRLNAIVDFLKNRYKLTGLKIWPSLNGRNFSELPPLVRKGLERAKISAITLMSDTSEAEANAIDLRAQVFERLNTGGERLNAQELRNSLYSGLFNKMLVELASEEAFTKAWGIPSHLDNTLSDGSPSEVLKNNIYFKRMTDVEIVLRFFAFRDLEKISGSVRSMLDGTMIRYKATSADIVATLKNEFLFSLELCHEIFGSMIFRLPTANDRRQSILSRPLFDAEMVAIHLLQDRHEEILRKKEQIKEAILGLAAPASNDYELMVGRANTATAIKDRILAVKAAVSELL